jgi:hypothetical protein
VVESKLGPLGTSATKWPILPVPGDYDDGEFGGMKICREKTCPRGTSSTTNPTWPDPGLNPGRRGGKPATNRLSYGAAQAGTLICINIFVSYNKVLVSHVSFMPKFVLHLQSICQLVLPVSIFFRQIASTKGTRDDVWLRFIDPAQ